MNEDVLTVEPGQQADEKALTNGEVVPRQAALSRLVMIATSAWEYPVEPGDNTSAQNFSPLLGHRELLRTLLSPELPGRAWLGRDVEGTVDYLRHGTSEVDDLADKIASQVKNTCQEVRTRIDRSRRTHRQQLAELRHRVVMDPARLRAATRTDEHDEDDAADDEQFVHLICLDLRFDFHLDTPSCHMSLSIWSARPWHRRYVPEGWPGEEKRTSIPVADLAPFVTRFHTLLFRLIRLLKRHFTEADRRVYRRKHVLPLFWVPVPARPVHDPADYERKQPALRRELARIFLGLGDPADCVSNASVLNGQFDVLRRFRRGIRQTDPLPANKHLSLSRAHYVIIPSLPPDAPHGVKFEDLRPGLGTQENHTAEAVTKLTDLEARRLGSLHAIHRDLLIWRNHLDVYDHVVERGMFLWDALSAHLLTRRRALRKVHHTVELLHQILLQAVGDIGHLSNRTRDCVAQIKEAADQLHTEYDEVLTERHPVEVPGLRGSLDRTGLFEQVKQHGEQTLQEANRVKAVYDDLLRTIGYAFDEWRLRESDVVQRLSAALGTVLGLLGVVTVLDATVDLKPNPGVPGATLFGGGDFWQKAGVWASWGLGAFVLGMVIRLLSTWVRSGRLGTRRFGRRYAGRFFVGAGRGGVWRLLKDISTDGLEKLVAVCGSDVTKFAENDHELATRFAVLWDKTAAMNGTERDDKRAKDIAAQGRRIEKWGLHTLLLTERAMRMHTHILPKLTCLYRSCTRIPGSSLGGPNRPGTNATFGLSSTAPNPQDIRTMIDFNEFALSLNQIGLNRDQAYQLELWLLHRQPQTARHLVALLTNLGLSADMTRDAVGTMLDRISTDLKATTLPTYPAAFAADIRAHLEHNGYSDWREEEPGGLVTARWHGRTGIVHVITDRAPTLGDVLRLCGTRLRLRKAGAHLVTTHAVGRRKTWLARSIGIRVVSLGWVAVVDERRAGESSRSRRR